MKFFYYFTNDVTWIVIATTYDDKAAIQALKMLYRMIKNKIR